MPPFAGQGMNSGRRDAMNLGRKVSHVLRGAAGELLLGRVIMPLSAPAAALRDAACFVLT